jgi:predicted anti-sigma-YlaC factor YlaD
VDQNSQFDAKRTTPELSCSEFDTLLTDAFDGVLSASSQRRFDLHVQQCSTCAPLFRETAAGMKWLDSLEEVEAPANLLHNILAATTMQPSTAAAVVPKLTWKERLSGVLSDLIAPARALVRQPRMAMTFSMAIFSLTLSMNLAGIKVSDLRHIDLRPSAIKEQATMKYYETSTRVVKYYENIRLVYEVESRLQELKRATTSEEPSTPPADRKKTDNERPDRNRKQNYYSMQWQNMLLANWSTNELNSGSNLVCFAASKDAAGNCNRVTVNDSFLSAELSRGLKPGKESGNGFGNKSSRSVLA